MSPLYEARGEALCGGAHRQLRAQRCSSAMRRGRRRRTPRLPRRPWTAQGRAPPPACARVAGEGATKRPSPVRQLRRLAPRATDQCPRLPAVRSRGAASSQTRAPPAAPSEVLARLLERQVGEREDAGGGRRHEVGDGLVEVLARVEAVDVVVRGGDVAREAVVEGQALGVRGVADGQRGVLAAREARLEAVDDDRVHRQVVHGLRARAAGKGGRDEESGMGSRAAAGSTRRGSKAEDSCPLESEIDRQHRALGAPRTGTRGGRSSGA